MDSSPPRTSGTLVLMDIRTSLYAGRRDTRVMVREAIIMDSSWLSDSGRWLSGGCFAPFAAQGDFAQGSGPV